MMDHSDLRYTNLSASLMHNIVFHRYIYNFFIAQPNITIGLQPAQQFPFAAIVLACSVGWFSTVFCEHKHSCVAIVAFWAKEHRLRPLEGYASLYNNMLPYQNRNQECILQTMIPTVQLIKHNPRGSRAETTPSEYFKCRLAAGQRNSVIRWETFYLI